MKNTSDKKPVTAFTKKVIGIIKKIPRGKVSTYGHIARLAGRPHGARGVVWILNSCSKTHQLPWFRVLNSKGKIAFPTTSQSYRQQKKHLLNEGVQFVDKDHIDLKFLWNKKVRAERRSARMPQMFK